MEPLAGIDVNFRFTEDTPPGKDPDQHSPTLRRYHQQLWSKPLPDGTMFDLVATANDYLLHVSSRGTFTLTSDAITTPLAGRACRVIEGIPEGQRPQDLGYTVGSALVFPGNRVDGKATLNGARGFHPRIVDRFDLTLECIRRHYAGTPSPLSEALARYGDFFSLFVDFAGYVEFFLLQDLVHSDGGVRFMHHFEDFSTPAVPKTVHDYIVYAEASNDFIRARNARIRSL